MSRARPWKTDTGTLWFDNRSPAMAKHLELLADVEEVDLDDIFEENLTQKQVLFRLHKAGNLIPEGVLERRRERHEQSRLEPSCRICTPNGWTCDGRITRHHFVPKWLMRELDHYQRYAARSKCTIPICVGRHRDLHYRGEGMKGKSIVEFLTDSERKLADQMLKELKAERPVIFELLLSGSDESYEATLIRDFVTGRFRDTQKEIAVIQHEQDVISNVAQAGG